MFEFSRATSLLHKAGLMSRDDFSYVLLNRMGVKVFSRTIPHLLLNEFPKSGGTWIGKMMARSLGLPFPRNSAFNPLVPSLLHCHLLDTPAQRTQLIVWRDPRDVLVSWYHHCFFSHGPTNDKFVAVNRTLPGYEHPENVTGNLERFVEDNFERGLFLKWNWNTFASRWIHDERSVFCRYEDFLGNPGHELCRVVPRLGGNELSPERALHIAGHFSMKAERARAVCSSPEAGGFIRQGKAGGWRDVMNDPTHAALLDHVRPFLLPLGYCENGDLLPLPSPQIKRS